MTIHEPATLLTDLLLGALAGWLAWRLHRTTPRGSLSIRWWIGSLALTGVSALVGGMFHGFAPNLPAVVRESWWVLTLWLICATSAVMSVSLLHALVPPVAQRPWRSVIWFKLLAFASAAASHPQFVVVIVDYGLTMAAWMVAALAARRAWRRWILTGVGLSAIAAAVQQLRWGWSVHFNHNDVYHLIQACALVAFQQAGRRFTKP